MRSFIVSSSFNVRPSRRRGPRWDSATAGRLHSPNAKYLHSREASRNEMDIAECAPLEARVENFDA
jgi:hypothetical protein